MKNALRQEVLSLRKSLTAADQRHQSKIILQRLVDEELLKGIRNIHLYYPINNEVCTIKLIQKLWKAGIDVIMPRTDFSGKRLRHYLVSDFAQLEKTSFNMLEPSAALREFTADIDIVLVPGIVFDQKLNRMGYGGGYYDRFLADSTALRVAPAYEFQVRESIPTEAHDIQMDYIITERRTYSKR